MKTDEAFLKTVYNLMENEVVVKFDNREGDAKAFYNLEGEEARAE
jgi:hypothetical protein